MGSIPDRFKIFSLTSLGKKYHRSYHTIYECENRNLGKEVSQVLLEAEKQAFSQFGRNTKK